MNSTDLKNAIDFIPEKRDLEWAESLIGDLRKKKQSLLIFENAKMGYWFNHKKDELYWFDYDFNSRTMPLFNGSLLPRHEATICHIKTVAVMKKLNVKTFIWGDLKNVFQILDLIHFDRLKLLDKTHADIDVIKEVPNNSWYKLKVQPFKTISTSGMITSIIPVAEKPTSSMEISEIGVDNLSTLDELSLPMTILWTDQKDADEQSQTVQQQILTGINKLNSLHPKSLLPSDN